MQKFFATLSGGEIPSRLSKLCFTCPLETFKKTNAFVQNSFAFFFLGFCEKLSVGLSNLHSMFSEERLLEKKHLLANFFFNPYFRSWSQKLSDFWQTLFAAFLFAEEHLEDGFSFWKFHCVIIFLGFLPVNFSSIWRNYHSRVQCCPCFVLCVHLKPLGCFSWKLRTFCLNFRTLSRIFWTFGGKISAVLLKLHSACPEERHEDFSKKIVTLN